MPGDHKKIIDTQQKIKCACVFWDPWECSRIRNYPDSDYESCTCICHKDIEEKGCKGGWERKFPNHKLEEENVLRGK